MATQQQKLAAAVRQLSAMKLLEQLTEVATKVQQRAAVE